MDDDAAEATASAAAERGHMEGLRSGLVALREGAGLQDRLVEKLLQQVMPTEDGDQASGGGSSAGEGGGRVQRPSFNLTTMSYNFRLFNARIGVVFQFQADAQRLLAWRRPTQTLAFLAVYSLVCLNPWLFPVLPPVLLVLGVLVPAFVARHPAPPPGMLSSEQSVGYSLRGPPLAPPATVRPTKELSKDFFRNMRDLQNSMADFTHAHDRIVGLLVPLTNFGDEALSSSVFLFLVAAALVLALAAHAVPWRLLFLVVGWALVAAGHPAVEALLRAQRRRHLGPAGDRARSWLDGSIAADVILDSAPETREVEIFELQRFSSSAQVASASPPRASSAPAADEWEPWLFSPSPYDLLSPARISGARPRGSRFFEDVLPPAGWEWSEKKWALDLWSREWVEERIITGVEVETEGERWVYDMHDEREVRVGVVDYADADADIFKAKTVRSSPPTWDEGDDGSSRRGDWRRRRWVRLVKRKAALATTF